jgi:hypothetical protein
MRRVPCGDDYKTYKTPERAARLRWALVNLGVCELYRTCNKHLETFYREHTFYQYRAANMIADCESRS